MSETDSASSSSSGAAFGGEASALVTVSQDAASGNEGWSDWAWAESDSHPAAAGVDMVSGDHDTVDWFPSSPADGRLTATLLSNDNTDPLVDLPPSDFAQAAEGLDDGDAAHFASSEPVSQDAVLAWDALHHPIDHSMPLDHVEWQFSGLLPLV